MIYMDGFLIISDIQEDSWFEVFLQKQFEIPSTITGPEFDKKAMYLNRLITWAEEGIEVQGDPKHVTTLRNEWGIENYKGLMLPTSRWKETTRQ